MELKLYKPKSFIKPWVAPNVNNISNEMERLLLDIMKKYPYTISRKELIAEFSFKYEEFKSTKVSGLYGFSDKVIKVEVTNKLHAEEAFCHEFSHLLQDVIDDSDYYKNYCHGNTLFTEALRQEQDACNISIRVWDWLHPDRPYPRTVPYYTNEDISWLQDYYAPYFENDLAI